MHFLRLDRSEVQFLPGAKHHEVMREVKALLLGLLAEVKQVSS